MIVRELLTRFGVDFDDSGSKKAESALDSLKSFAGKVGLAVSAGAVAAGLYKIVEMGAAASENLALLRVTFGETSDAMLRWADEQSKVLGRSKYSLRQYAGAIGVVTKGLTGSEQDAAKVSQSFAALAVDFKAFFDLASDEDALNAFRSALTGETEPMKRFGVVMDEASLAAFAMREGHRKLWKDMSAAEKTMLRYRFIMGSSTVQLAMGAAAREADSFGNRLASLKESVRDIATALGAKFLPMAISVLDLFKELTPVVGFLADVIGSLASQTYFFEWVAGIAALRGGLAFLGMLVKLYVTIRTQVLLSLVSLLTSLQTITVWLGIATKATWAFIAAWAPVVGLVLGTIALAAAIAAAGVALAQTIATGTNFIADLTEDWFGLQTDIVIGLGIISEWFSSTWKGIKESVSGVLDSIREKIAGVLPAGVLDMLAKVGVDLRGAEQTAAGRTAGATAAPGSTVSSRSVNVTNGGVTVNVNGSATPGTAQAVGREVQKALDQQSRNLAATAPAGG